MAKKMALDTKRLDTKQLNAVIKDAQSEIAKRERFEQAKTEIHKIIGKYKLDADDIKALLVAPKKAKAKSRVGKKVAKAPLPAMFKSPDGTHAWSGRGRSPLWVNEICEQENLTTAAFKTDARYKA